MFFADVLRVRDTHLKELWVYIVQRTGSPDILAMGTCTSQKAAEELALKIISDMQARKTDKAAAS